MQKHLQKLLLLLALVLAVPWATNAQTLTVANGTATNTYVPIYGYYCDEDQHNQMVYPSSMLTDMDGSYITSLTFYQSQVASSPWGTTVTIKLKEIADSVLTDLVSTTGAVTVWTGVVNGTTATQVFNFTLPYSYQGGNLLVDITTTSSDYSENYWYGISRSGASVYVYGYAPLNSIYDGDDGNVETFLPKATFGYSTGSFCLPPTDLTVSVDDDEAEFSWPNAADPTAWIVAWGPTGFDPDTATVNVGVAYDTSYTASYLPTGMYDAYVRAICSGDSSVWYGPVSFSVGFVVVNMATSGSDTLRTCAAIIYDDGGPSGSYSNSISSSELVVYPSDSLHALMVSGSSYTESTYDYLRIYSGVGTSGETLFDDYGVSMMQSFGPFYTTGPITITFHSDGSVQYSGFEINVSCVDVPDCPRPESFATSSVQPNSIDFHWTDNVGSAWTIAYGPTGFTVGDTNTSYADFTDTMGTVTGLTGNTVYDFYLMAVCGSDTSWSRMLTVRTACDFISSLPYQNGFESDPYYSSVSYADAFPYCWNRINDATSTYNYYPYITTTTSYVHSGTKGMYWYFSTSTTYANNEYAVLPGIDTTVYNISDLTLAFYAKTTSTSYHPAPIVGVMTNPTDASTFTPVYTFSGTAITTTWTQFVIPLSSYTGHGNFIAIKCPRPSSTAYMGIDDIFLTDDWCNPPTNVTASSTIDEVTISWNTGSASSYRLIFNGDTTYNITDNSYTITGLTANTEYSYAVAAECSSSMSEYIYGTIRTQCNYLDSLPYTMGFESSEGVPTGSSNNNTWVNCWGRLNNGSEYFGYPYVSSSSTYNHTTGGSRGLYWYNTTTTGTYGDYQCVILPGVDTDIYPINSLQLRFWAKSSNTSYSPVFQVGVMTDPSDINTFQQVGIVNVGNSTMWNEYVTDFSSFEGYGAYMAVKAVRPSSSWYAYVDDFKMELLPACPEVADLDVDGSMVSVSSAMVSWTTRGGFVEPTGFDIELDSVNSTGTPTSLTSDTTYIFLSGLEPGTEYKVRVRANCGSDGEGSWDSITFTTHNLLCAELDPNTADTVYYSNSTTGQSGCIAYSSYGNTAYQTIWTAAELTAAGLTAGGITGIDLGFTPSSSYAKEFTIFMTNSNVTSISNATLENPNNQQQVYGPAPHPMNTTGWQHYEFTTPFMWDGVSSIMMTTFMNQPAGTSHSSSSGLTGYYESASNKARYRYRDSSPYTLSDYNSGNSGGTYSYRAAIHFYKGECIAIADCAAPIVAVTNVSSNEVTLEWAAGYDETSWDVEYRVYGGGWITAQSGTSDNSYTFTGLVPATHYQFRVGSVCSSGNLYTTMELTTPCLPTAVPFTENFETFSTSTSDPLPTCWYKNTNYSSNYPYASTSYNHSGGSGRSMYMYSTSSTWTYMVLPLFAPAIDSLQVSFWLYKGNTSYTHALEVGVMTDPEDVNTFTSVATVTPSLLTTWEVFDVPLSGYHGNGRYIAIMSPNGVYSYPYLDDLTVDYIPACPRVGALSTRYVSTSEATVYWTPSNNVTEYLVEYGPQGFPQGFGTVMSVTEDSARMYSLAMMTTYDVYVSAVCASGDTSDARLTRFTTACGEIATLPYMQNFENCPTGGSTSSTWVDCWYRLNNGTSYYGYPYVSSSTSYNHTTGGTKGLYWCGSTTTGTYGDYQVIILPPVDTTVFNITSLELSFWARSSSTSYSPAFQVGVMTDPTNVNSFQQVGTANVGGNTSWTEYTTTFENFTGYGAYLAIKAVRPSSTWYAYVDDIKVDVVPDCPAVSNMVASHVTPNSFEVSWDEEGSASSWTVEYGPAGFLRGTGTQLPTTADSIAITGLIPNTTYDVYVTVDCGSGIGGTNLLSVTTACAYMTTLPFFEDFESQVTGSSTTGTPFIPCWILLNNGTSYGGYPYVSSNNHTNNGTKGLYWYNTTTTGTYGDYQCVVLPGVDTDVFEMNELQLSFWAMSSSTSYYPVFQVGVMADPSDINSFQQVATVNVGNNTTWSEHLITFENFTGNGCNVAIKATRASWTAYVDDIKLEVAPDCPRVEAVTVSNITPTSADISWTEVGEATEWTVEYGPQGFTRGTGISSVETTNSVSLTSLTANTAYDVYITSDCATGLGGTNMVNFRTECEATITLPYTMGFEVADGVSSGSSTSHNFITCWHRLNNGSQYFGYPYVGNSTTYAHTGSCGLYWYNTTTTGTYGDYEIVVLPPIDVTAYPINTLQLKFWAKASSGTPTFQVGVMTDPNNPNSFQQQGTVSANTQWEQYTVGLAGYSGAGQYVAIRSLRASWTAYVDDISLELAPACPQVINVTSAVTGTTGAQLVWGVQSGFASYPSQYEIEVEPDDPTESFMPITVTSSPYLLTGLLPGHSYSVRIRGNCDSDGYGAWSEYYDFSTLSLGCAVVDATGSHSDTIAGGTTTTYNIPLNNYYNYTFSEQIYLGSELGSSGPIVAISFDYAYSSPSTVKNNCSIYLANTTLSSVNTTTYEAPENMTLVYTGPMNCSMGWNRFEFNQNPFTYSGGNLAVAVVDNSGSYNSSSYVFNAHSASGLAMSWYSDSYQYPNSSMSKTTHAYRSNAIFDIQSCLQMATCAAPLVVVDSIDTNFVAVNWAPGYEETAWDVEYRVAGGTWTNEGTVYTPGYIFTGLTPNQEYEIRITGLCTDSNMATAITVRTPCAPYSVPFHENFASFATGSSSPFPSCWAKYSNYSSGYPYISTSYSISGGRSVYMYSGSTSYSYFTLPPFNVPLDTLQVSFWLYRTTTSNTQEIQVGIMTDPADVNTFELVGTAYPQQLNTWEPFEIPLNNYHGNGQYIALMSPNGVNSYPYLDELMVEYVSPCPRVRNVSTSNVGLHSARVSWDTTAASSYELEYGPAGFAFGTGTRITGLTDDTLTISGLAASTLYDVYVRGLCTPDTGNWSFAHTFATQCGLIDSVPFFEDFNHIGTGTSIHSPQCWYGYSTYSSSYPYPSNSYNRSGVSGAAMYMYLSNTSGYYTMLQLPQVDTTVLPINSLQISFSLLMTTTSYTHGIIVGVCNGQGMQNFTPIDTVVVTASTGVWQDFEIPFNNYTGYGSYITLIAYAAGTSTCYPYLDDILLETIPSCIRPDSLYSSNATSSSVTLGWRERGTATQWEVEYGPTGFTPGTGTRVIANTNPTTLTSMPASYVGDFYVRSICDIADTSLFNREPCRFSTSQLPATIPYYYDFESETEWAAWQTSTNTYIDWTRGTAEVDSGNYSMYISPDGGLTYGNENFSSIVNAAIFRDVDFGTVDTSFTLTYRAKVGGTVSNRYDGLMVFLVDPAIAAEPSNSGITSPWGNVNDLYRISLVYLDTTWSTHTASFDTIHGVKRVAFFWFNQNTGASYPYIGGPAAVDNIHIDYSPCPRPVNLDTVTVSNTTASLHWDGTASANYRVAYRVSGASASTNVYVNTTTNNVTLTGLTPMTTYVAWVQKLCGTDSSLFSDGVEFQTDMCDDMVDVYDYDATMSTTTSSYGPIGYATYNYSYVQTIIDSAHMAGMTDPITAFAFNATNTTSSDYYTGMDIYMANVPEADLSSGFIFPNTTTHQFVQVMSNGNLNFTDVGWQMHSFDTSFTWDGHSNVLFAVNRHHGSWSSSTSFAAHTTSAIRTRYAYQDSGPVSINDAVATSSGSASYVGDLRFISCGSVPVCHEPIITGISHTYEDATITWTGDGTAYDVNIKESAATNWPATDIHVTGNTYTFTGLQPATSYTFRVRQDCSADTLGYSDWVIDGFVTDSLPCVAPDSLHVTSVTNTTATLDWSPRGYENMWEIHVWTSGGVDSVYTAISHPATVGGFTANTTYNASIRALCGSLGSVLGNWGDTITFTTAVCPDVTGLGTRNVTANSVDVYWNPDPLALQWIIEYGFHGFDLGTGTQVTTSLTTYTINGLLDDMEYDFRVRAVCGDNWQSEGWATTSATTLEGGVPCDAPTAVNAVVAGNAATVSWTANTGNISFVLEYGTRGFALGSGTTVSATASPVTISNLAYETAYDVYVKANCADNTSSAWSAVASFTTEAQGSEDCDPVTDLAATNVTESAALLTWTPGNSGDEWEVVLTTAAGATVSENSTTERQFQLTDLTPGTAYVAKVRTVCGDGQYSDFASVSFTTNSVGIADVAAPACTIYPNPTSGATTVSVSGISGKVRIAIVDMNGREVTSETLDCSGDCAKTMSVDNLAQGAYFVRITGENANMVRKLIVR